MFLKCYFISLHWRGSLGAFLKYGERLIFIQSSVCCSYKREREVKSLSRVWLFATPWTVAYQAPPSMGFSGQRYWSGLPFPSPEDLPDPGIKPRSTCTAWRRCTLWAIREARLQKRRNNLRSAPGFTISLKGPGWISPQVLLWLVCISSPYKDWEWIKWCNSRNNKLWKILKEMGIPDHLTCLLRNLYAGQEATVRTGHGQQTGSK